MTHVCIFQGVRFDPDASLTLRLEFARSNTKVSKPVNKQAVLAPHFFPREPQFSKSIQNSFIHSLYFMKWIKILSFIHSFARSFVHLPIHYSCDSFVCFSTSRFCSSWIFSNTSRTKLGVPCVSEAKIVIIYINATTEKKITCFLKPYLSILRESQWG